MGLEPLPAWILSVLAIAGGLLCLLNFFEFPAVNPRLRVGLILLGPWLIFFGGVYAYWSGFESEITTRQFWVRSGLAVLFALIIIWNLYILRLRGRK